VRCQPLYGSLFNDSARRHPLTCKRSQIILVTSRNRKSVRWSFEATSPMVPMTGCSARKTHGVTVSLGARGRVAGRPGLCMLPLVQRLFAGLFSPQTSTAQWPRSPKSGRVGPPQRAAYLRSAGQGRSDRAPLHLLGILPDAQQLNKSTAAAHSRWPKPAQRQSDVRCLTASRSSLLHPLYPMTCSRCRDRQ
jgi:hypothetical protein